jgi:hypothetical protein
MSKRRNNWFHGLKIAYHIYQFVETPGTVLLALQISVAGVLIVLGISIFIGALALECLIIGTGLHAVGLL